MGLRRQSRECALQILFQSEFDKNQTISDPFGNDVIKEKWVPEVNAFANQLVQGVKDHKEEIDAIIHKYTENWAPDRIAIVDRNILRFATFEIIYLKEIPSRVTMNEAIEVAKIYGNENSGGFINGILDRIQRDFPDESQKPKSRKMA